VALLAGLLVVIAGRDLDPTLVVKGEDPVIPTAVS
jgi:hypothetical protein